MSLIIGSHVSCNGKDMMVSSVKEALSYGANAFMFYTGAPQNTRRKPIEDLKIDEAKKLMAENNLDINHVVVHAPYIINLGNSVKEDTFELAVSFLREEIARCEAIGVKQMVLHPGAHVGSGSEAGINQIIKGLNEVLTEDQTVLIALETMAGKGSECGRTFEELKQIIDGVHYNEKLSVCLDTCHVNDAGYDIKNNFDEILAKFDEVIGIERLSVIHVNDSKNELGAAKDRHENIGHGTIGFEALNYIVNHPKLTNIPKILETPYVTKTDDDKDKVYPPYKYEIEMFRNQKFNDQLIEDIRLGK